MDNVKKVVAKGRTYLYFQVAGSPRIKLTSPWPETYAGSALEAEVTVLRGIAPPKPIPGVLRACTRAYELSPGFTGLAAQTRDLYRVALREFDADLGDLPVQWFKPSHILQLRDTWALRGYRCANLRLVVLRHCLKPAMIEGLLGESDPFSLIDPARRPSEAPEPHILWPERVVTMVIETAIAEKRFGLARAVAIARYQGARRGDIVKLTRKAREDGRFRFLSGKRKVPVDVEEDEKLTAWLDATPTAQPLSNWQATRKAAVRRTVTASMTLVYNMDGGRYTDDGLGQALADLIARLAASEVIESGAYDLHGLRHTRGVELALAGCTDAEGAAAMGHASPSSFVQYRRQAERIRLSDNAAQKMRDLRERDRNATLENRLENSWKTGPAHAPGTRS